MLPFVELREVEVGHIVVPIFGLLVLIGVVCGLLVARREIRIRGLDVDGFDALLFWTLIPGFLFSRVFELAFYHPDTLLREPWQVLLFWRSMSSFGGFIGGAAGLVGYLLVARKPLLPYSDAVLTGLVVGWIFGRLGCTLVHDHPGIHSDFPLAVAYPDGPRHDLGLYEWLFTLVLAAIIFRLDRHRLPPGVLLGGICVAYAAFRFPLDFLRAADLRYFGLTAAQYACLALMPVAIWTLYSSAGRKSLPEKTPFPGGPYAAPAGD